jgi:hypothetical protein
MCLYHHVESAVAEHSINLGHWIKLQNTMITVMNMKQMGQILREAIGIELHPNNMNRKDSFP